MNDLSCLLGGVNLAHSKDEKISCESSISASFAIDGANYVSLMNILTKEDIKISSVVQFVWHKLLQVYSQDEITVSGVFVSNKTEILALDWEVTQNSRTILEVLQVIEKTLSDLEGNLVRFEMESMSPQSLLHFSQANFQNHEDIQRNPLEYPIELICFEKEKKLQFNLRYNQKFLSKERTEQLVQNIRVVMDYLIRDLSLPHSSIQLLSQDDLNLLLDWNTTETKYDENSIMSLFEQNALESPEKVALVFENTEMSYRELNDLSNQLANYLKKLGVVSESRVALCFERGINMIICILGVMKSGGVFVPIDPNFPVNRKLFLLDDINGTVLITQNSFSSEFIDSNYSLIIFDEIDFQSKLRMEDNNNISFFNILPHNLVSVFYTSGTTGRPKGVLQEHNSLLNHMLWLRKEIKINDNDICLFKTNYAFDFSYWEYLLPLLNGAKLIIAKPEGHTDVQYLLSLLLKYQINTLFFIPSMCEVFFRSLLQRGCSDILLKNLSLGGEPISPKLLSIIKNLFPNISLFNFCGPTEVTITSLVYRIDLLKDYKSVPIGKPIDNFKCYVLDRNMNPVPIGVKGELFVSGIGVARGYLLQPELTKEKFLNNHFASELDKSIGYDRLYRIWLVGYPQYK